MFEILQTHFAVLALQIQKIAFGVGRILDWPSWFSGQVGGTIDRYSGSHGFFNDFTATVFDDIFQLCNLVVNLLQFRFVFLGYGLVVDFVVHFLVLVFLEILEVEREPFESVVKDVDLLGLNLSVKGLDSFERLFALVVKIAHCSP